VSDLIVVDNPKHWPLHVPGAELVAARDYLTRDRFVDLKRAKVFNLCRTYGYQTIGYYVSLLAAARGHRPLPSVATIQDLRQTPLLRIVSEDLEDVVQRTLAPIKSKRFELSIYFGRNVAKRYDRLAKALFNHFPAPLLRAEFIQLDQWRLQALRPIALTDIPEAHRDFVIEQAESYFDRPHRSQPTRPRYELAVLINPDEVDSPSDERALARFERAAKRLKMATTFVERQDYGRIGEFDGLFIRETTYVNHHTYRFARRAEAEGLVVIDDSESIIRCTNKVYQAELFDKRDIPCPKTLVVHRDNRAEVSQALGFPCVLKRPDSSFSAGVVKAEDEASLAAHLDAFFDKSELVVAQEFLRSSFDWRVGVLGRKALFVCRYHMARGHWQIQKALDEKRRSYGKVDTIGLEDAPDGLLDVAVRAAGLIGDGLYGVDVKEVDGRFFVMEINDNPNIEAGCEDAVAKDALWDALAGYFLTRIEQRGRGATHVG